MKRCSKCKQDQPRAEFYRHARTSDGLGSWCRSCFREQYAATKATRKARKSQRYHADLRASRAAGRAYREANKERLAAISRKSKYGLSAEQYAEMVARSKGRCDLCGDPPSNRGLSIDHCHSTGVVRGLLCARCNTALGKFRDDPQLLREAANYVERHQTERLLPEGSPHDGLEAQNRCAGNFNPEGR